MENKTLHKCEITKIISTKDITMDFNALGTSQCNGKLIKVNFIDQYNKTHENAYYERYWDKCVERGWIWERDIDNL